MFYEINSRCVNLKFNVSHGLEHFLAQAKSPDSQKTFCRAWCLCHLLRNEIPRILQNSLPFKKTLNWKNSSVQGDWNKMIKSIRMESRISERCGNAYGMMADDCDVYNNGVESRLRTNFNNIILSAQQAFTIPIQCFPRSTTPHFYCSINVRCLSRWEIQFRVWMHLRMDENGWTPSLIFPGKAFCQQCVFGSDPTVSDAPTLTTSDKTTFFILYLRIHTPRPMQPIEVRKYFRIAFEPCAMDMVWFDLIFSSLPGLIRVDSICIRIYKSTLHSFYMFYLHFDCHFRFTRCSPDSFVFIFCCVCVCSPFSLSFILCFVERRKPEMSPAIHAYELSFDQKRWIQSGKKMPTNNGVKENENIK